MLFYSVLKTLIGKPVSVHLKNDVEVSGTLQSADQFLNLKLDEIKVKDEAKHPHLLALKCVFIRGSVVRAVELPREAVDVELLQDAARVDYATYLESLKQTGKQKPKEHDDGDESEGEE